MTTAQDDPYDLQRFVDAQAPVYDRVLSELRIGEKRSHWMWYIFPQIAGLGRSAMAQRYAITGRDEAAAYLRHDILGPRLRECTRLVLATEGRSIVQILGGIDAQKFRSCMTLFEAVAPEVEEFGATLEKYCGGQRDEVTLEYLDT